MAEEKNDTAAVYDALRCDLIHLLMEHRSQGLFTRVTEGTDQARSLFLFDLTGSIADNPDCGLPEERPKGSTLRLLPTLEPLPAPSSIAAFSQAANTPPLQELRNRNGARCNAAKSYAARYDEDPRIAARIEMCFGLDAIHPKDRIAACAAYARALPFLSGAKSKDAQLDLDRAVRTNRELGC